MEITAIKGTKGTKGTKVNFIQRLKEKIFIEDLRGNTDRIIAAIGRNK